MGSLSAELPPQASLQDLVAQHAALFIPWSTGANNNLACGFDSHLALTNRSPWTRSTAFEHSTHPSIVCELGSDTESFRDTGASSSSDKTEHMSASLGVTVGNDYLNVNVTGSYDERSSQNAQAS